MSGGLYSHTTRSVDTILTAAIYNADHQNHITNQNPSMTGGYSDNVSQMQASADPGDVGSESLAGSLAGELEAMRFVIARIVNKPNWYEPPDFDLGDIGAPIADGAVTNAKLADMVAATVKGRAVGAVTGVPQDLTAAQLAAIIDSIPDLRTGFLHGLTLSNGADAVNDINVAPGRCRDGADGVTMAISATITKRLDAAWAVGTNQGGRDAGAISDDTWYVWLIRRPDTGVVDALFSLSASAPTMPANYTQKRRVGSIVRTAAAIKAFVQNGDKFLWSAPVQDVSTNTPPITAVTPTLTVPVGIIVDALISFTTQSDDAFPTSYLLVTALSQANTVPSVTAHDLIIPEGGGLGTVRTAGTRMNVLTNTSAQIRYRVSASSGDLTVRINTLGWIDDRGRLA